MARPQIPEMQELAHYVQRLIKACQTRVYRLSVDHPHVSNSTMRDLSSGRTKPDTATLRRAALALSEALQVARSEDLIDDPFKIAIAKTSVTPENDETLDSVILRSMISLIPTAAPVAATKKEVNPDLSENPIKTPQEIVSWVQHHFYKLSLSEQMETLSKLTAMTSRAIDRWQNENEKDSN